MRVVFIHHGDVIKDIFLLLIHAPHAVLNNHRQFVRKRRVVRNAVGNGCRHQMAVTVFVLQAFAVQGGAPRRAAEQESTRAHVARRPRQIADALKAEHGVENIKRHHHLAVVGVRRGRSNPRRHRAGFVDALLQHLPGFVFLVEHQLIGVLRRVKLAHARINAKLAEHAFHTEGARFIRHDRHHELADFFVADHRV